MNIDLDMNVLGLDEALKHKQVVMRCPNDHAVKVRLMRGSGSSTIACPVCSEMVEPRLSESQKATRSQKQR